MPKVTCRAAAICLCAIVACAGAEAQALDTAAPAPAGTHAKKLPHRAGNPVAAPSPAANLNAPSTDFSNVEPETGEPRQRRQQGPNVRPSIDSNGRPVMGLGF